MQDFQPQSVSRSQSLEQSFFSRNMNRRSSSDQNETRAPPFLRSVSSPLQGKWNPLTRRLSFLSGRTVSVVLGWSDVTQSDEEGRKSNKEDSATDCSSTHISDLSDRCIVAIMAKVSNTEEWVRYKLVCRRWCRLANEALQALKLKDCSPNISTIVLRSLDKFIHLVSLQLHLSSHSLVTNSLLKHIGKSCPQLKSLNIHYLEGQRKETSDDERGVAQVTDLGFDRLFKGCSRLGELTVAALWTSPFPTAASHFHLPPSISDLSELTALAFHSRGCLSLPSDFGRLRNLKELSLGAEELLTLPESCGQLENLTELDLSSCAKLSYLQPSLGQLTRLKNFNLKGCHELRALPESIGNLSQLIQLNCQDCYKLESLPDSIGNLPCLQILDLHGCRSLTALPEKLGGLTSLTSLDIDDCPSLTTVPDTIEQLPNLSPADLFRIMGISGHLFSTLESR